MSPVPPLKHLFNFISFFYFQLNFETTTSLNGLNEDLNIKKQNLATEFIFELLDFNKYL